MLADDPPHREDAGATVLAGPGRLTHLLESARTRFERVESAHDIGVADDLALANDHDGKVRLT
jgi:hypothetical protein